MTSNQRGTDPGKLLRILTQCGQEEEAGHGNYNQRLVLDAGNQDLEDISRQAWLALQLANEPRRLFRFGGVAVRVEGDDEHDRPVAQVLTPDRFSYELARAAEWIKQVGKIESKPVPPPMRVVNDMLAFPRYPLPPLTSIVAAPVFAPDGTLRLDPGYNEAARTFFAAADGFRVPAVSEVPSAEEVERAKVLLLDELLGDFPFVVEADRPNAEQANALALVLDPYLRPMIAGPTPLRLIEDPTPGVGKGLLADVALRPAVGRQGNLMPAAGDDSEWRKRISAALLEVPPVIFIDNVVKPLDSGALAAAITTTWWNDRRLGVSEMIRVPNRALWVATANNPVLSGELARRSVRIRLDPKVDRPWQRTGFRHKGLRGWVDANRPRIVWAALTLVQAWVAKGMKPGTAQLGSFERWAAVHSGILDCVGIPGFLENLEEFYDSADIQGAVWRQFIDLWFDKFSEREVGGADLFGLAQEVDGLDLGTGSERAQRISFGRQLGQQRDRVIGDCRVVQTRTVRRAGQWRLIKARPGGNPFDVFHEMADQGDEAGDDQWSR